jgi:uncharacterized alkaline shock family protein YloU
VSDPGLLTSTQNWEYSRYYNLPYEGGVILMETTKKTGEDRMKIADEVIATIAGIAASEVENVTSMSEGIVNGIASMLGRKNMASGVKVEVGEKEATIEVSLIVEYGCKIHEVAKNVHNKVREAVEAMTGLQVVEVAVNVLGVNVERESRGLKKEETPEKMQKTA